MNKNANLDLLIPREDIKDNNNVIDQTLLNKDIILLSDLEKKSKFYRKLRKPSCQRQINLWDIKHKLDFIKSFLEGKKYPVITLKMSEDDKIFIIDGSHRLSALISWINDDYGDGEITKKNFHNQIPINQIKNAQKTREVINNKIGKYKDYKKMIKNNKYDELNLKIDWIKGDFIKTKDSYYKLHINKSDEQGDKKYFSRSGKGSNYWTAYKED